MKIGINKSRTNFYGLRQYQVTIGEIGYQIVLYLFFSVSLLICIFPFYYIITIAISSNALVRRGVLLLYPRGIHFKNFIDAFKITGFGNAAFISVSRTVIGTFLTVISCSFMGYSFSKKEFWGRAFWYKYLIVTMYFTAGLIAVYLNIRMLGLYNNFLIYIIYFISAYYVLLCKTFIENLPPSLEESAHIDGAGYLSIFTKIVFPLSKPIIATIAIFTAVHQWNAYMDTLIYIRDSDLFTLQFILRQFLSSANRMAEIMNQLSGGVPLEELENMITPVSVQMTVTSIVVLPILFVYPIFQRYFVKGIMLGAIKG